jgi:hypothetical protein
MSTIQETSISIKITYLIRNILSRPLFKLLEGNLGRTLDIGGGSFYKNLAKSTWSSYFVLEPELNSLPKSNELDKIISMKIILKLLNIFHLGVPGEQLLPGCF